MERRSFTAEELRQVIEGRGALDRVPIIYDFWIFHGIFGDREEEARAIIDSYPSDAEFIELGMPEAVDAPANDPAYRWVQKDIAFDPSSGIDNRICIEDWDETDLDDLFGHFPSPEHPNLIPKDAPPKGKKYRICRWWRCLFERLWSFRGMENSLTDFYLYPDEIHATFRHLTDFYLRAMERARYELDADAIFVSDDIGTQNAPFFSEAIFLEFFKPYYKELFDKAHSLGMHFWLHTCGNIELYLPHLIEIGLDVIHPIQRFTMDQAEIVRKFGGQICFWAGFDVQQAIPYGTPEEVRAEVRRMIDNYGRKDGRLMLTCGNALTPDCKVEALQALYEESYRYGLEKMAALR